MKIMNRKSLLTIQPSELWPEGSEYKDVSRPCTSNKYLIINKIILCLRQSALVSYKKISGKKRHKKQQAKMVLLNRK
jgi:hypothetical protein